MNSKLEVFAMGILVGIVLLAAFLNFTELTPVAQQKKDRQAAIAHGAAHWTVNTNGETSFEWNK